MHFKNPEVLYALLLLIIPLLVHLFQLRKFKKERFTNVKFLKKANLQTRKSSKIKKWLILCTRLLLLAALVVAFAQPYLPSATNASGASRETVIFLDNSYSMQARGANGILLRRAVQEVLENLPKEGNMSLFTNNKEFRNVSVESLRKDLQQLSYSPVQMSWEAVAFKAGNLFSTSSGTIKNFIAISDFQVFGNQDFQAVEGFETTFVQLEPENLNNASIDTAFVTEKTIDVTHISVKIRAAGNSLEEVPVSLHNNGELIAKKTIVLDGKLSSTTTFEIPADLGPKGKLSLDDSGLRFDNELFFSINENKPIEVVVVNNANDSFLRRIFTAPDFNLRSFPENQVDFNALSSANLIILNEPEQISSPLGSTISSLLEQDVFLMLIPSEEADLRSYNSFFGQVKLPAFQEKINQEKLVTTISYQHPLYESVFDEEVHNFQYPSIQSYYRTQSNENPILSLDNGQAFFFQKGNSFVFTSALNTNNTNFQMAPLIVPTLYNIGNLALESSQLYYTLGKSVTVDVNASLDRNEILKVSSEDYSFIPRQQSFQNKVELRFEENPEEAGHYSIMKDSTKLQTVSFNIDRSESNLNYVDVEALDGIAIENSVAGVFAKIESENEITALWKWFVIFGLLLLIVEMLILKFFK